MNEEEEIEEEVEKCSSETDTETEFDMSTNEYLDSISWVVGQVKEQVV